MPESHHPLRTDRELPAVLRLPGQAVGVVLAVPRIFAELLILPRTLIRMEQEVARMRSATERLPDIERRLAEVAAATSVLHDVRAGLADVTEATYAMRGDTAKLAELMPELNETILTLRGSIEPLAQSAEQIGRVAARLPGGRRAAAKAATPVPVPEPVVDPDADAA